MVSNPKRPDEGLTTIYVTRSDEGIGDGVVLTIFHMVIQPEEALQFIIPVYITTFRIGGLTCVLATVKVFSVAALAMSAVSGYMPSSKNLMGLRGYDMERI